MERFDTIDALTRGALGVLATVALFSCSAKTPVASEAAQAPLSVGLILDPTPAKVGTERITVTVRDSSGAPVTGAAVRIAPSFATVPGGHAMAMNGMGKSAKAVSAMDAGDGVYHVDVELTKATHWTFVVDVSAAHTQTTTTSGLEVR